MILDTIQSELEARLAAKGFLMNPEEAVEEIDIAKFPVCWVDFEGERADNPQTDESKTVGYLYNIATYKLGIVLGVDEAGVRAENSRVLSQVKLLTYEWTKGSDIILWADYVSSKLMIISQERPAGVLELTLDVSYRQRLDNPDKA